MNYDPSKPIAVFLGPSLEQPIAAQLLAANYYPPARMGDIYRLVGSGVRLIVLIDGLFHQTASVWQRELLEALDNGISVIGASSMGALRAAELHPYGMIGCGLIFEWYRDGLIEGDDEVALHHADEYQGFRPLSEPLVNIRYTLGLAAQQGCVSPEQASAFIEVARSIYYPERSYPALLASPLVQSWPPETQARLAQFLRHRTVNLKRQDAIDALKYCAAQTDRRPETDDRRFPRPVDPRLPSLVPRPFSQEIPPATKPRHQGRYYRLARYHRRGFWREDGCLVSGESLLAAARQKTELVKILRPALVKAYFLHLWAQQRHLSCPPDYLAGFRERWIETYVQPSPQLLPSGGLRLAVGGLSSWLSANGLTEREFAIELEQRALLAWLVEQGPGAFGLDCEPYELFGETASSVPTSSFNSLGIYRNSSELEETHLGTTPKSSTKSPFTKEELLRQAAETCFLVAWAKDNGISCPPAYLEKFIQTWEEKCLLDRRGAWLEAANLSETTYLAVLAEWATAAWLIDQEPPYFGYTSWSFEVALLKELQMTGQARRIAQEILSPEARG